MTAGRVGELLRSATERLRQSGSKTARLDAELLLGHVLQVDRASLLAHPDAPVIDGQAESFQEHVARREKGEPVAYIRGLKEFYGLVLQVDNRALIPRPETELLVDLGLARIGAVLTGKPRPAGSEPVLAWDVGTGSGAVVVAMAVEARRRGYAADVRFLATDASDQALRLAIENAVGHGVADMIEFAQADLAAHPGAPPAELMLANLPYVPTAEVPKLPVAASFEPVDALDGGEDGLELVRRLLDQLPGVLAAGGMCLLEIGGEQAEAVQSAMEQRLPGWPLGIETDLSGEPRVAQVFRPNPG